MDIPLPRRRWPSRILWAVMTAIVLSALPLLAYYLRLSSRVLVVDGATLWVAQVRRGDLVIQVPGRGELISRHVRVVAAPVGGVVQGIFAHAGSAVEAGTLLLQLSNPIFEADRVEAEYQYEAAQAELQSLEVRLKNELLTQEAAVATARSALEQAQFQARAEEQLFKKVCSPKFSISFF